VPELTLEEVRFRVYRDALLTARGTARRATYRRDTGDFRADGAAVDLTEARGGPVRITTPLAGGNAHTREFFAAEGIRFVQAGTVATTGEAQYTPGDGLVRGARPITVRGAGYSLDGPGFVLDPRTGRLEVQGGTRAVAGEPP